MKTNIMKLLAIGAVVASSQASALPSFYNTTYSHQYQVDFTTEAGSLSIAETSNRSYLAENFEYARAQELYYSEDIEGSQYGDVVYDNTVAQVFLNTDVSSSSFSSRGNIYDGFYNGDTTDSLGSGVILASDVNFSLATSSVSTMFDVVGGPVDFSYLALSEGAYTEYSLNIERNDGGQATNVVDVDTYNLKHIDSYTLNEGTYSLTSSFNMLTSSDESAYVDFYFHETQTPVSVPEPYSPLLLVMGLLMIARLKKAKK